MQHFHISKYDRSNPNYAQDWTTLEELLEAQPTPSIPDSYLALERAFLDAVARFLAAFPEPTLACTRLVVHEQDTFDQNRLVHQAMLQPIHLTPTFAHKDWSQLLWIERLMLFQLAARDYAAITLQDAATGVALSTMDDGFYWFVSVPDSFDVHTLVSHEGLFVMESLDIFAPE